ncbi:putative carboxylesterase [Helianthus annuus]|nr:putative carboxylesterase [Helianthus annuus]
MVEKKDQIPQKEGTKLCKCWLYGGTNYRRIVEPLDIAELYKNGKTNYIKDRSYGCYSYRSFLFLGTCAGIINFTKGLTKKKSFSGLHF